MGRFQGFQNPPSEKLNYYFHYSKHTNSLQTLSLALYSLRHSGGGGGGGGGGGLSQLMGVMRKRMRAQAETGTIIAVLSKVLQDPLKNKKSR